MSAGACAKFQRLKISKIVKDHDLRDGPFLGRCRTINPCANPPSRQLYLLKVLIHVSADVQKARQRARKGRPETALFLHFRRRAGETASVTPPPSGPSSRIHTVTHLGDAPVRVSFAREIVEVGRRRRARGSAHAHTRRSRTSLVQDIARKLVVMVLLTPVDRGRHDDSTSCPPRGPPVCAPLTAV